MEIPEQGNQSLTNPEGGNADPVPIPFSVYWREFRTRIVPGLVFILSIIALIRFWGSVVPDPESDIPGGNSLVVIESRK